MISFVVDDGLVAAGIDNAEAMVEKCREKLSWMRDVFDVDLVAGDIVSVPLKTASVVVMNYTLQFVPVRRRGKLLRKCDLQGLVDTVRE